MSADPKQLDGGAERAPGKGKKQSTLVLDKAINQTATILPKISIFEKSTSQSGRKRGRKGVGNTHATWLNSERN